MAGGEDAGEDAEADGHADGAGNECPGDGEVRLKARELHGHGRDVPGEVHTEGQAQGAAERADDERLADDHAQDLAAGGADGAQDGQLFCATGYVGGH